METPLPLLEKIWANLDQIQRQALWWAAELKFRQEAFLEGLHIHTYDIQRWTAHKDSDTVKFIAISTATGIEKWLGENPDKTDVRDIIKGIMSSD